MEYEKLTAEILEEYLDKLSKQSTDENRTLVVQTGYLGSIYFWVAVGDKIGDNNPNRLRVKHLLNITLPVLDKQLNRYKTKTKLLKGIDIINKLKYSDIINKKNNIWKEIDKLYKNG